MIVEETKDEDKSPYANQIPKFNYVLYPESGTKTLFEYEILTQRVRSCQINSPWAFPASFACVQTPENRLFITGGMGDNETSRRTIEVIYRRKGLLNVNTVSPSATNFAASIASSDDGFFEHANNVVVKEAMNNRRIDHSLCFLTDQFIFASGSYLQTDQFCTSTERYDIHKDRWAKFPPLTVGRCFHASCGFEGRFVFVLCGLTIVRTEKESIDEDRGMTIIQEEFHWRMSNSIERLDAFKKHLGWAPIEIPDTPLSVRRSPGVV